MTRIILVDGLGSKEINGVPGCVCIYCRVMTCEKRRVRFARKKGVASTCLFDRRITFTIVRKRARFEFWRGFSEEFPKETGARRDVRTRRYSDFNASLLSRLKTKKKKTNFVIVGGVKFVRDK